MQNAESVLIEIAEEDGLRADMYDFIASLLRTEPSDELIAQVAVLQGDKTPIGSACLTLAHLAKTLDNGLIRNEYVSLFIGVGRGEILPFASYYLTGFLNDKPLANLRSDMSAIGIRRAEGVKEPEDHIASLFDMMSGLIRGRFGRRWRTHAQRWLDRLDRPVPHRVLPPIATPPPTRMCRRWLHLLRRHQSLAKSARQGRRPAVLAPVGAAPPEHR